MVNFELQLEYEEKFGNTYSFMIFYGMSDSEVTAAEKLMRDALDGKRGEVTDKDIMPTLTDDMEL